MADIPTQHGADRIVIEPQRGWSPVNWRDLWRHRELLYFLTWRDIKVRYKQTVLGALWAVLQPLVKMVVFTIIFKGMAHMGSEGYPYAVFLFAGMLPWQFFSGALRRSSDSIVNNANVIGKVYFPRLLIPTSAVAGTLVDHALSFLVLGGIMVWYGIVPTPQMLAVVPLALFTGLAALGVGAALSALTVAYRDLQHATPFLVDTWFFVTPVVWSVSAAGRWKWLVALNPMCGVVEAYRAVLLPGRGLDAQVFLTSLAVTAALLVFGLYFFRRLERGFADVV
jgi:lipopolysaccharide transport system permease protein